MSLPTLPLAADPPAGPSRRQLVLGTAAAAAATLLPAGAQAQSAWPNKPVRVIVPFPPGGLTDAYARSYCEALSRKFGQPFNIENKTGAGGTLGAGEVAKAAPDGYTLLISTSGPLWQAKVLYKKLPYTPVKDFDPVALFPSGALLVAVNANVPAKNLRELITFAKTNHQRRIMASTDHDTRLTAVGGENRERAFQHARQASHGLEQIRLAGFLNDFLADFA